MQEAQRQQALLRALRRGSSLAALTRLVRSEPAVPRGLQVYRANAAALAHKALAAAYPVLQQLLGPDSFGLCARALWHAHAPRLGDIAQWGAELSTWVASQNDLAAEPYLSDVARLEWAVHQAHSAADSDDAPANMQTLAQAAPSRLWLRLRPGTACVVSRHPIVSIWRAHQASDAQEADRFAPVRAAFSSASSETALVWRQGWKVRVAALATPEAAFTLALLQGRTLGVALSRAGPGFAFEPWLLRALPLGWIDGVENSRPPR